MNSTNPVIALYKAYNAKVLPSKTPPACRIVTNKYPNIYMMNARKQSTPTINMFRMSFVDSGLPLFSAIRCIMRVEFQIR